MAPVGRGDGRLVGRRPGPPHDLDTIADLQKLPDLFRARGYNEADSAQLMHGNWRRLPRRAWKA